MHRLIVPVRNVSWRGFLGAVANTSSMLEQALYAILCKQISNASTLHRLEILAFLEQAILVTTIHSGLQGNSMPMLLQNWFILNITFFKSCSFTANKFVPFRSFGTENSKQKNL